MDKIKPAYRRAITLRYLRWAVLGFLAKAVPVTKSLFSFYPDAISVLDLDDAEILENRVLEDNVDFTQHEKRYIDEHCLLDRIFLENDSSGRAQIEVLIARVKGCHVLGHTGTCIQPASGLAVVAGNRSLQRTWKLNWNQARIGWLREQKLSGSTISMLGFHKGHKQYYHFFVNDFLPLCYYLLNHYDKSWPLNILVREELAGFQENAYRFLQDSFPGVKIIHVRKNQEIITDELIVMKYLAKNHFRTFSGDEAINFLRRLFLDGYGIDKTTAPGRLLYIGRGDARIRRPTNELEVIAMLQKHGFEAVEPGRFDHSEQVGLFNSASLVVGIHGAGLTNVMFCRPGTHLLEISPANYVQSTYMWMARKVGMNFSYFLGGEGDYHQQFYVDIDSLERKILGMLAASPTALQPRARLFPYS